MSSFDLDVQRRLQALPWNEPLPGSILERLASLAVVAQYPLGQVLFYESELHSRLYFISSGVVSLEMRVSVNRLAGQGSQRILTVGPGEILAWSALLADGHMTTTAIVTEPLCTIEFDTAALKRLCRQDHEVGYYIMHQVAMGLSRRLLATRLQLLDLFQQ